MKPVVTYEKRRYNYANLFYLSRKNRQLALEPYASAVVRDVSADSFVLGEKLHQVLQTTIEEVARLEGYAYEKMLALPTLMLRTEALASSQIEHFRASNRNVASAQLGSNVGVEAKIVNANLQTLIKGITSNQPISHELLVEMNRLLLSDNQITDYRTIVNWIGTRAQIPQNAQYVPPHPEYVHQNMDWFIKLVNRNDIHPLILCAVAHAYFEIIHPFEDGNGRVGRAIIQIIMKQSGFTQNVFVPISVGLVSDVDSYVGALNDFKVGNYESIIRLILENTIALVPKIYETLEKLMNLKNEWKTILSANNGAFAWQVVEELFLQPVIDAKYLKSKFGVSDQVVRMALAKLLDRNIIYKIGTKQRNMTFEAADILSILDDFIK